MTYRCYCCCCCRCCVGGLTQDAADPIETLSNRDIERIAKPRRGSIKNFFKVESDVDHTLKQELKRLGVLKQVAVEREDYKEAKMLKAKIEALQAKHQQQQSAAAAAAAAPPPASSAAASSGAASAAGPSAPMELTAAPAANPSSSDHTRTQHPGSKMKLNKNFRTKRPMTGTGVGVSAADLALQLQSACGTLAGGATSGAAAAALMAADDGGPCILSPAAPAAAAAAAAAAAT